MKKILLIILSALFVLCIGLGLVSCGTANGTQSDGKKVCKVTFFDNYVGGKETVIEVEPGAKSAKPADPERLGFSFDGWFDAYEGGSAFDFDAAINGDTNVYAHWKKTANIITFKYNDGGVGTVVTVADGGKVDKPADPTSDIYSFMGWYTDAAYTKPFDFDTAITSSMIIYAGWSKSSVKVVFNLNYSGSPEPVTVNANVGQAINLPQSVVTERSLYAFDGWYLKSFPSAGDSAVDLTAGVEDDVTLYAKWTRTHYAVTFNPNDRTMQSVTVEVPVSDPVAAAPALERTGYTLDAVWYSDAALKTPAVLTKISDDVTVYAKWNINKYEVFFDLNYDGASGAPAAQSVEYQGKVARPAAPARDGFLFTGWFTQPEGGEQFNFDEDVVTGELRLYAQWMQSGDVSGNVTVTFDYNAPSIGLKVYKTVEIAKGEALTAARMPATPNFSDENLMFIGWYADAKCSKAYDPEAVLLADTTVYARILVSNTFEAEYVNLSGKQGVGSSVELPEEAMLFDYSKIGTGSGEGAEMVSNDWYIAGMYYKGAFIEFEIHASRAVENAVLMMRVSSEFKELHYNPLTPETYRIDINPVLDDKGELTDAGLFEYELPLTLPEPNTEKNSDPDGEKTPFENVIVSYKFHLEEGDNVIRFTTNNSYNYGAGTFQANAPMIDCIMIYADSDVILEMTEYTEFLEKRMSE